MLFDNYINFVLAIEARTQTKETVMKKSFRVGFFWFVFEGTFINKVDNKQYKEYSLLCKSIKADKKCFPIKATKKQIIAAFTAEENENEN